MSFGKLGKVVRSAVDRSPGSLQRLIDKARGTPSPSELEIKSLVGKQDDLPQETVETPSLLHEDLKKLCNVSGLRHYHRCLIHGLPAPIPKGKYGYSTYHSFQYQRRIYARYGAVSNVAPGKLWPSPEELADKKERARLCFMMTTDDVHRQAKIARDYEESLEKERRKRDDEIAANILKSNALKEQMYQEAAQAEEELLKAEEKRQKRIEQTRKFFSYALHVKDPRFKEKMQEMIQTEKDKHRKDVQAARKERLAAIKKSKETDRVDE